MILNGVEVRAYSTSHRAICPACGQASRRVHGWYTRHPQEISSVGCTVRLILRVKRFRCVNPACIRKAFAEPLSGWLPAYARRTLSLTRLLYAIALEIGAEVAHRVAARLGIRVSADTLLRILRQLGVCAPSGELRIIGVDDWALKRGRTYGTVIVNLETHRVVELLPDRTAETLAAWLRMYPTIERVTRDRSTDYSAGIRQGAPQAVQVADRWHLLLNLRQMLERYLTSIYADLQRLPVAADFQTLLNQQRSAFIRTHSERRASVEKRNERLAFYEQIQALRQQGWNLAQLAQELACHPATIRKYYYATTFPERKPHRLGKSILDPYLPYLERRFRAGCENAQQLWREIQQQGYPGTKRQVMKWLQLKRTHLSPTTPYAKRAEPPAPRKTSAIPSSKQLAWFLVRDDTVDFSQTEHLLLTHLRQHSQLATVYALAQRFIHMVKTRAATALDAWLVESEQSSIYSLHTFALGLRQDVAAVRAALETAWSNGQTEGQVNRLKLIKRQMYGRAKFDLLRLRVIHPP